MTIKWAPHWNGHSAFLKRGQRHDARRGCLGFWHMSGWQHGCRMLKRITFVISALLLSGCSATATIKNAWIGSSPDGYAVIHVEITAKDVELIRRNQIYFSVVLNECSGQGKRFPMEPMIQGKRASDFDFEISNVAVVDVVATGPFEVIKGYREPCVMLEGGGYAGARLKSNRTPLKMRETLETNPKLLSVSA